MPPGITAQAGAQLEAEWRALFGRYARAHPDLAQEFERRTRGELPQQLV